MAQNYETITIPAAVGAKSGTSISSSSGRVFACVQATAEFVVVPDSQSPVNMSTGRQFGNPNGQRFRRILFYNASAIPIEVTFYVGDEAFQPETALSASVSNTTKDAPTYLVPTYLDLPTGQWLDIVGVNNGKQRKLIVIFNPTANLTLKVQSPAGVTCGLIPPNTALALPTNATLRIRNDSGLAAGFVPITEIYYL